MKYKNILIIKMSSLGDILHTLPSIAALRSHFKNAKISWLVHPQFADFIPKEPIVNEVICFDKEAFKKLSLLGKVRYFFEMRRLLHSKKFDLVIDMQGLFKSAVLAAISGAKTRMGYCEMRELSFLVSKPVCGENKNAHVIERYLDVVRFLGAKVETIEFPMPNLAKAQESIKEKLKMLACGLGEKNSYGGGFDIGSRYVVFAVGARWQTKEWILEHFAKLAQMIAKDGFFIVLVGGESEKAKGEVVRMEAKSERVIDLTGKTTLKELAVLIKECDFFVSADTGPLHLATAFKKPLAALYGPTLHTRTGPYANKNASVIVSPVPCAGCLKKNCRDWRCMHEITPEMVYEVFKEKING
ncbi:MAG: glycosyltransferase family 9 protein [Campylobacteraceae bacterium]|jgi:heptosyltransferase-1/heptosyltransferase-2|nr:glycosyltransferase family 9 protein [Campylobacteraceae bacterium]